MPVTSCAARWKTRAVQRYQCSAMAISRPTTCLSTGSYESLASSTGDVARRAGDRRPGRGRHAQHAGRLPRGPRRTQRRLRSRSRATSSHCVDPDDEGHPLPAVAGWERPDRTARIRRRTATTSNHRPHDWWRQHRLRVCSHRYALHWSAREVSVVDVVVSKDHAVTIP